MGWGRWVEFSWAGWDPGALRREAESRGAQERVDHFTGPGVNGHQSEEPHFLRVTGHREEV